jgi:NADH:ubiquinone oxidoreductase subunit F (NADH-binding)
MDAGTAFQRLLPARPVPEDLDAHLARFGPRPPVESKAMIDTLDDSGLRGRGGADFPTGVKWRAVMDHTQRGRDAVVVANAAECEPASFKDRFLLTYRPHLVLDGLEHAAEAVGARTVVIYTTRSHSDVVAALRTAIRERRRRDDSDRFIDVQVGPNRYVAGE